MLWVHVTSMEPSRFDMVLDGMMGWKSLFDGIHSFDLFGGSREDYEGECFHLPAWTRVYEGRII